MLRRDDSRPPVHSFQVSGARSLAVAVGRHLLLHGGSLQAGGMDESSHERCEAMQPIRAQRCSRRHVPFGRHEAKQAIVEGIKARTAPASVRNT